MRAGLRAVSDAIKTYYKRPVVSKVTKAAENASFAAQIAALPTDAKARKDLPICTGVLDYFPLALAEVARCSKVGNDQHNPGQPLHWARGKSADHADCLVRHLMQRGTVDSDGVRHAAKAAWRALAILQEEMEASIPPVSQPWVNKSAPPSSCPSKPPCAAGRFSGLPGTM